MQQTNRSRHRHITSFQVISLGFLSVILLGSLLLMLPIATKSGQSRAEHLDRILTMSGEQLLDCLNSIKKLEKKTDKKQ